MSSFNEIRLQNFWIYPDYRQIYTHYTPNSLIIHTMWPVAFSHCAERSEHNHSSQTWLVTVNNIDRAILHLQCHAMNERWKIMLCLTTCQL